jgi:hypothetical protein
VSGEQQLLILERVGIVHATVARGEGVEFAQHEEDVFQLVTVTWKVDEDVPSDYNTMVLMMRKMRRSSGVVDSSDQNVPHHTQDTYLLIM